MRRNPYGALSFVKSGTDFHQENDGIFKERRNEQFPAQF